MPIPLPALTSRADYEAALAEVSRLFDELPDPSTPEGDRFSALVDQVEAYEAIHFPMD